jgi:hypothetical protein
MKRLEYLLFLTIFLTLPIIVAAQRPKSQGKARPTGSALKPREIGSTAVVMDETLSVLRQKPSLFAVPVHRMQRGRRVQILGVAEAEGVKFYKVSAPPASSGWVQADAVFGGFRPSDEERLARLVQAADGFDQIELASAFFEMYPRSQFRPAILLLYGDLLEETALKMSKDANSKLKRSEMAASAAPVHSYYLNFVSLDRYRKLGVVYLFNPAMRAYHYDGASWREIAEKFPTSREAREALKRLDALKLKMEQKP